MESVADASATGRHCVRCLAVPVRVWWRGVRAGRWPRRRRSSRFSPCAPSRSLTQASDLGTVPGLEGGQLGGERVDHAAGRARRGPPPGGRPGRRSAAGRGGARSGPGSGVAVEELLRKARTTPRLPAPGAGGCCPGAPDRLRPGCVRGLHSAGLRPHRWCRRGPTRIAAWRNGRAGVGTLIMGIAILGGSASSGRRRRRTGLTTRAMALPGEVSRMLSVAMRKSPYMAKSRSSLVAS